MKQFMAIFLGAPSSMNKWQNLDEKTKQERGLAGMEAWHRWMQKHEKSIRVTGSPLGKTKKVGPEGVADMVNQLTAFTVVEAESHDAAARMFLEHPHFTIFPGDHIEVMECMPVPTKEDILTRAKG